MSWTALIREAAVSSGELSCSLAAAVNGGSPFSLAPEGSQELRKAPVASEAVEAALEVDDGCRHPATHHLAVPPTLDVPGHAANATVQVLDGIGGG